MALSDKKKRMLIAAYEFLAENHPATVRQVYYQLVAQQIIENNRSQYQAVSKMLVQARLDGTIPWAWMEDRLRRARPVSMWGGLSSFKDTVLHSYRRDVWITQPNLVEVWLEKDALSAIFEDILKEYGVTLNVGRGFDGWDSIHNASQRYRRAQRHNKTVTMLYFGDFDPSGEDMVRSLRVRLHELGTDPVIEKCALTEGDIRRYNLPSDKIKPSDSRSKRFIAKHGDVSVELDALPIPVLRNRLRTEVETRMDLDALQATIEREDHDLDYLRQMFDDVA
jgi:hypothetical protein